MAIDDGDEAALRAHATKVVTRVLRGGVRLPRAEALAEFAHYVSGIERHARDAGDAGDASLVRRSTEDAAARVRSCASLDALSPVAIRDLRSGAIHSGRVLRARTATVAAKSTAVMCVLEDARGDVVPFALHNALPPEATSRDARRAFPRGSQVAVKEPYYKLSNAGTLTVRVDDPSNVVVLSRPGDGDDAVADAATLRARGNAHHGKGRWRDAEACYGRALDGERARRARLAAAAAARKTRGGVPAAEDGDAAPLADLLANRAACRLRRRAYDACVADCDACLALDPDHEKATYRRAASTVTSR